MPVDVLSLNRLPMLLRSSAARCRDPPERQPPKLLLREELSLVDFYCGGGTVSLSALSAGFAVSGPASLGARKRSLGGA